MYFSRYLSTCHACTPLDTRCISVKHRTGSTLYRHGMSIMGNSSREIRANSGERSICQHFFHANFLNSRSLLSRYMAPTSLVSVGSVNGTRKTRPFVGPDTVEIPGQRNPSPPVIKVLSCFWTRLPRVTGNNAPDASRTALRMIVRYVSLCLPWLLRREQRSPRLFCFCPADGSTDQRIKKEGGKEAQKIQY